MWLYVKETKISGYSLFARHQLSRIDHLYPSLFADDEKLFLYVEKVMFTLIQVQVANMMKAVILLGSDFTDLIIRSSITLGVHLFC